MSKHFLSTKTRVCVIELWRDAENKREKPSNRFRGFVPNSFMYYFFHHLESKLTSFRIMVKDTIELFYPHVCLEISHITATLWPNSCMFYMLNKKGHYISCITKCKLWKNTGITHRWWQRRWIKIISHYSNWQWLFCNDYVEQITSGPLLRT